MATLRPVGRDDELAPIDTPADIERKEALKDRIFSLEDMLSQETEQAEPLLGRYLQKGEVTILGGHGGQGKTTMALGMERAVVEGGTFLDAEGEGGRVLHIDLEQGIGVAQKAAMRAWFPDYYQEGVPVSVLVKDMDLGALGRDVVWCNWQEGASLEMIDAIFETIDETLESQGPFALVVLDPVYKLMLGSNVNEIEVVGRLIQQIGRLRIRHPLTAWLIPMHPRKPAAMGSKVPDIHDLYGSASWGWWAGNVFTIQRGEGSSATFKICKDRMTGMADTWTLTLKPGKGFERLLDGNSPEATRTPAQKIWRLLQQHPQQFTKKEIEQAAGLTKKQVDHAVDAMREGHGRGKYPGLRWENAANNKLYFWYEDPEPVIQTFKQEFNATEEEF